MEKNHIKEQLDLTEKLLCKVNSKEEYLFLLGQREALFRFRYLIPLMESKVRVNLKPEEAS